MRRWSFVLVVGLVGSVLGAHAAVGGATGVAARRCNGMARLCVRSIAEVAFATTHNSMSSPADGFRGPNQGKPIAWQLDHGIRGFQIDAYEGVARGGSVYTELSGPFGSQATDLPPAPVAAAVRIHERLGAPPPGTATDVYLCHTFCEIGAVSLAHVSNDIRAFLDKHPNEVLAFVVEDYVTPERLRDALSTHGLDRELLAVEPGTPLPTLREMIDAHTRLFVTLENGDGAPTLPNAFTGLVEETPFTFLRPSALGATSSCDPNRGAAGSLVFQLNHWVTPPTALAARAVNGSSLLARVKRCTAQRGRIPTLIAVDFAESSDVVGVVGRLNRGTL
ncbi:MAG: hypothetical protein ACHQIG_12360 [Acidimicrobiia bacterium]